MSSSTREQIIENLKNEQFDLLVIGGGINGVAAAWDASLRGLSVALIDKGDFGAATSAGCFKIIHGGLRYLQHLDFRRLLESAQEQRLLRKIAPHLFKPLPFLIPCYKPLMKRRAVIRLALSVYEFLARNRNSDIENSLKLPNHKVVSKEHCLEIAPKLSQAGLEGGVLYYDVQMNNCERLTLSVLQGAIDAGCRAANYLCLKGLNYSDDKLESKVIDSVQVKDFVSGEEFSIKAKSYLNATGPWIGSLAASVGLNDSKDIVFSKGIQLVLPQLTSRCAFAVEGSGIDSAAKISRGARSYFIQPWNGYSLVGTSDELVEEEPDSFEITPKDIKRFVAELKQAYPSKEISEESVLAVFGGLRPVADDVNIGTKGEAAKVARNDLVIDHFVNPFGGIKFSNLVSMRGVKYTTFRLFAERAIDLVVKKIGSHSNPSCQTRTAQLPSTPNNTLPKFLEELQVKFPHLEPDYLLYLMENYGRAAEEIAKLTLEGFNSVLHSKSKVRLAEIIYCVRNEMVEHLDDLMLRRVAICAAGVVEGEVVEHLASEVARELNWSDSRMSDELERFYEMQQNSPTKLVSCKVA